MEISLIKKYRLMLYEIEAILLKHIFNQILRDEKIALTENDLKIIEQWKTELSKEV